MTLHGPTFLEGPLTKNRSWWASNEPRAALATQEGVSVNDFRPDLVRRVRAEIAAGTYDTPEKWDIALDRLLDRLNRE